MRRQEESEAYAGVRRRRLPLPPSPLRQPTDGRCRTKMALWCYQVMDYCNLSRSTVELAMNLLDRFLSTSHAMAYECLEDRSSYQLAAMTSLYTAVKTCEVEVMDPHIIATLSRGMCTEVDVVNMEQAILEAVGSFENLRVDAAAGTAAIVYQGYKKATTEALADLRHVPTADAGTRYSSGSNKSSPR